MHIVCLLSVSCLKAFCKMFMFRNLRPLSSMKLWHKWSNDGKKMKNSERTTHSKNIVAKKFKMCIAFREKSPHFICTCIFRKTKRILLHFILNLSLDMHLFIVKLKLSIQLLIVVHQSIVVVFLHNKSSEYLWFYRNKILLYFIKMLKIHSNTSYVIDFYVMNEHCVVFSPFLKASLVTRHFWR